MKVAGRRAVPSESWPKAGSPSRGRRRKHSPSRHATHNPAEKRVELATSALGAWSAATDIELHGALAVGHALGSGGGGGVSRARESSQIKLLQREVELLRSGWEAADERAKAFEQEALQLRCAETMLRNELRTADGLTDWWRRKDATSQRTLSDYDAQLVETREKLRTLTSELERAALQVKDLTTALTLHEAGREHLMRRLTEKELLLDEAREKAVQRYTSVEDMRTQERKAHAHRVEEATRSVSTFYAQIKGARLDVDELAQATRTYEALLTYVQEEQRSADAFAHRVHLGMEDKERELYRTSELRMMKAMEEASRERADVEAALRRTAKDSEVRRLQELQNEVGRLRQRLAEAEKSLAEREATATMQLASLKEAYKGDASALAVEVESLRGEALRASVYAKSSTRLLREQNERLKHGLGHTATLHRAREVRLIAWVGWRLLVNQRKELEASTSHNREMVAARDSMIDQLQGRVGESRAKYIRQLHTLQTMHEHELDEARKETQTAKQAMERLKHFSAHKLREMAEELERLQQQQQQQQRGQGEGHAINDDGGDGGRVGRSRSPSPSFHLDLLPVQVLQQQKLLRDDQAHVHGLEAKVRRLQQKVAAAATTTASTAEPPQQQQQQQQLLLAGLEEKVAALEGRLAQKEDELKAARHEKDALAAAARRQLQAQSDAAIALSP